jgi:hypothetical protein
VDNGNVTDSTQYYYLNPPRAELVPEGEHCLSSMGEEFFIHLPCESLVEIEVVGYTTNGKGEASDCVLYSFTTITIEEDSDVDLVLPLELSGLQGISERERVVLEWKTLSEINSDRFEIERSICNRLNSHTIGEIAAQGESALETNYRFVDNEPEFHKYYRLKMIDFDVTYEYSPIIYVQGALGNEMELMVTPNPMIHFGTLRVLSPRPTKAKVVLTTSQSRIFSDEEVG